MPGPYTRSKWAAEQAALTAARAGLDVVVVSPTVPIGPGDHSVTPPTAMLMHLQEQPSFYLDCVLNLVDVRDVATGIMLAAEHGRAGERYILGGEAVALQDLVRLLTPERAATKPARRVPAALAPPPVPSPSGSRRTSRIVGRLPPSRSSASRCVRCR